MNTLIAALKNHKRIIIIAALGILALSFICAIYFTNRIQAQSEARLEEIRSISNDRGDIAAEAVVYDSTMGEIVIKPTIATASDIAAMFTNISSQTISDPEEIWLNQPETGVFTTAQSLERADGSIGVLEIPAIRLSASVFESDDNMEDMEKGIAHFPSTSAFEGNVGMSSHNINPNGSAGYFLNLYKLGEGDIITYITDIGTRNYTVSSISAISEEDWSMLGFTDDNRITLITCISGQPDKRLCIQAKEVIE